MFADPLLLVTVAAEFVLMLLGAIVALQEDWAKAHRWSILGVFAVVGISGMYATIKTAQQSAVANSKLSTSIAQLGTSTGEIARVTSLNTSLQEKLLESNGTIAKLAQENLLQATGSKGYCYIFPSIAEENPAGLPLQVIGSKYPVYDVIVNIHEQGTAGDSLETIRHKAMTAIVLNLGNVSGHYIHHIGYNLPVQRGKNNRFQINIYSRSALFTEYLVVTWNNGHWNAGVDLGRNGTNKWIVKTPQDFPYLEDAVH